MYPAELLFLNRMAYLSLNLIPEQDGVSLLTVWPYRMAYLSFEQDCVTRCIPQDGVSLLKSLTPDLFLPFKTPLRYHVYQEG